MMTGGLRAAVPASTSTPSSSFICDVYRQECNRATNATYQPLLISSREKKEKKKQDDYRHACTPATVRYRRSTNYHVLPALSSFLFFFLRLGFNFYFTPLFLSLLYSIRVPFYRSVEQQVYELCQLLFFFLLFFFFQPLSICPTCPEPFDSVFSFVH